MKTRVFDGERRLTFGIVEIIKRYTVSPVSLLLFFLLITICFGFLGTDSTV